MPNVDPKTLAEIGPFLRFGEILGRLISQIAPQRAEFLRVNYSGNLGKMDTTLVSRGVLKGYLERPIGADQVNLINAVGTAENLGLRFTESRVPEPTEFSDLIEVEVGSGENKAVIKIDTATNKEIARIPLPGIVHEATLTADGKFLYTTLRKANRVVVVRTADDKIVANIPQKGYPDLVTMEPSGRYALVTNRYADHVSVIDLATHAQVRAIPVGKAPHGMALRPR